MCHSKETVKPALVTTCLQRPLVYSDPIFLFSLKHVLKESLYKGHCLCFPWAVAVDRFDCMYVHDQRVKSYVLRDALETWYLEHAAVSCWVRLNRSYFHEVTVVRKICTQIVCDFHSLPSFRENRDEMTKVQCVSHSLPNKIQKSWTFDAH